MKCKTLIKYETVEKVERKKKDKNKQKIIHTHNKLAGANFLPDEWPVNSPIQRLFRDAWTMYYLIYNIVEKKHTSQTTSHRYPLNYSLIITRLLLESLHKSFRVTFAKKSHSFNCRSCWYLRKNIYIYKKGKKTNEPWLPLHWQQFILINKLSGRVTRFYVALVKIKLNTRPFVLFVPFSSSPLFFPFPLLINP